MFDPCSEPLTPGWPLRNALLLAAVRWGVRRLKVLCVRDSSAGRAKAERCFVVEVSACERMGLCVRVDRYPGPLWAGTSACWHECQEYQNQTV